MFGHQIGIGFRVLLPHYDEFATLSARIPHPTLANRFGSDVGVSSALERKDVMVDMSLSYVVNQPRWRVLLGGGPTYFHTSVDLVNRVSYSQVSSALGVNVITVTGGPATQVTGSAWGFNAGGDVATFPWTHVGFGGGAILNKGTIDVQDPLTATSQGLDMSSVTLLVGPRFRF